MSTRLPITPDGSWTQVSTELSGVTYGFEFLWNEREGCWYCNLRDGQGALIVTGRKVVLGALFRQYRGFVGVMQDSDVYVLDTDKAQRDPGYEDLGRRVILLHATDAELA
jgi:hypothetical protein